MCNYIFSAIYNQCNNIYCNYFMIFFRNCSYTHVLYKQRFFSIQLQSCLPFLCIELQMLLRCWLIHHYTETHFIFSIFGSMSKPRSIYTVSLWSTFSFSASFSLPLIIQLHSNKQTCFLLILLIFAHLLIILDDNDVDEESK